VAAGSAPDPAPHPFLEFVAPCNSISLQAFRSLRGIEATRHEA
jgi:hypothetical protein